MSVDSWSNSSFLILAPKTLPFPLKMLCCLSLTCDYASKKQCELEDLMVRCFQPVPALSLKVFASCLGTAQFKKSAGCVRRHIQTWLGWIFLSLWAKVKALSKELRETPPLVLKSSLGLELRQSRNTGLWVHNMDGWQVWSWEGALRSLAIHRCPIALIYQWVFLNLFATI